MLSKDYSLYIKEIISLVRSLVIKSQHTINAINNFLTLAGDELSIDPKDWKYYRNLNGEYYVGSSGENDDQLVIIKSLDTLEFTTLTKQMLSISPITLNEYRKKGIFYNELLLVYPDSELLINGMLFPVDQDTAITANDYTVLTWDRSLVDSREINLIKDLQQWIYNWVSRWDNPSFAVTDKLYSAGILGVLFLQLPNVIVNLRLEKCKTPEVHRYHLWSYLAGFFRLDEYSKELPITAALFLYKNIEHIANNAGRSSTLDWLESEFSRPQNLLLRNIELVQDSSSVLYKTQSDSTEYYNDVTFRTYPYSDDISDALLGSNLNMSVNNLTTLLSENGIKQLERIDIDRTNIIEKGIKTQHQYLPTGVIQCGLDEPVSSNLVDRVKIRIDTLFHMLHLNKINFLFNISVSSITTEVKTITGTDVLTLLVYVSNELTGNTLVSIPEITINGILDTDKTPLEIEELRGLAVPEALVITKTGGEIHDLFLDTIDNLYEYHDVFNKEELILLLETIENRTIRHMLLPTLVDTSEHRSQLEDIIEHLYTSKLITLSPDNSYVDFFNRIGINPNELTTNDLNRIAYDVVSYLEISEEDRVGLESPQSYIKLVLSILSSYMVSFVDDIKRVLITPLDYPKIQSDPKHTLNYNFELDSGVDVCVEGMSYINEIELTENDTVSDNMTESSIMSVVELETGLDFEYINVINDYIMIPHHQFTSTT